MTKFKRERAGVAEWFIIGFYNEVGKWNYELLFVVIVDAYRILLPQLMGLTRHMRHLQAPLCRGGIR